MLANHQECCTKLQSEIRSLIMKKTEDARNDRTYLVKISSDDIIGILKEAFPDNRPSFHNMLHGFMAGYIEKELYFQKYKVNTEYFDKDYIISFNVA